MHAPRDGFFLRRPRLTLCPESPYFSRLTTTNPRTRRNHLENESLSEIIIHDDENFERALRRFKESWERAGIMSDLRKHRHYEKPSERRKRRASMATRRTPRNRPVG